MRMTHWAQKNKKKYKKAEPAATGSRALSPREIRVRIKDYYKKTVMTGKI